MIVKFWAAQGSACHDTLCDTKLFYVLFKGRRPTQKTTHPNKNSLHKQFAQTLLSVFCLFKREKGGSLHKLSRNCLCKLFWFGWVIFWVGRLPFSYFPHLPVVNKFLRFCPSQTDWNWWKLIKVDSNWLKMTEKSIATDRKSTRIWRKTIEIAENWLRRFRREGGVEKHLNYYLRKVTLKSFPKNLFGLFLTFHLGWLLGYFLFLPLF